jgi:hypothetical protein
VRLKNLNISFELSPSLTLDPKLLKERNGKLLVDVQGKVEILLNNKCFFSEPSLALLELGVCLTSWRRLMVDKQEDFYYFTMEHDETEDPILAFRNNGDNDWSLFSIWQHYKSKDLISLNDINDGVEQFLVKLDKELKENFEIKVEDFL